MLSFLKDHPFAVDAFFESAIVLTFAVPKAQLQHLIPPCLTLDTFNNEWAFVAMALVQTKDLRPRGFPTFLGNDFYLIGYRVFVRYTDRRGKKLRGLYILKSETNRKKMEYIGNLFTHYNYSTTDINITTTAETIHINSLQSKFSIGINTNIASPTLPVGSPFNDFAAARKFAGPLPFTFTYDHQTHEVLIIEGVRKDWNPVPIQVDHYQVSYLETLALKDVKLANAFKIDKIPYYWKKGRREKWLK